MRLFILLTLWILFTGNHAGCQDLCTENEIRTHIIIQSTPQAVWQILVDFADYPKWHPYILSVDGQAELHTKIKVTVKETDSTTSRFSAYILENDPGKCLSWGGSLGFLFRAKHYFLIEQIDDTHVQLVQGEYWRGWFGKNYGKRIYKSTYDKFIRMNEKLRSVLENGM